MWFNCVEEMIFIDDDFNSDLNHPSTNSIAIHRRKIQILQAAYIVCLYQNWEGSDSSKSRIRRYRFATLVSVSDHAHIKRAQWTWTDRQRLLAISVSSQPLISIMRPLGGMTLSGRNTLPERNSSGTRFVVLTEQHPIDIQQSLHLDLSTGHGIRHLQQLASSPGDQRDENAYGNTRSLFSSYVGRRMPPANSAASSSG